MRIFDRQMAKKGFAHTWYLYPLGAIVLSAIWAASFYLYHQPSAHQRLSLFFGANVAKESFIDDLKNRFDREELQRVDLSYAAKDNALYYSKLRIAVSQADLLILDQETLESFQTHTPESFLPFDDALKRDYLSSPSYYAYDQKDYGALLKEAGVASSYDSAVLFDPDRSYYLVVSAASKNIGSYLNEGNQAYTNALRMARYLLEGAR